MTYNSNLLN